MIGPQQSSTLVMIPVTPIHPNAKLPTKGSKDAAGFDLYAAENVPIPAGTRAVVSLGIRMAIPPHHYGRIAPRSGLALKSGIDVGGGVVDADYRGEVKVILFNHGKEDFAVHAGDRVAQMIVTPCPPFEMVAGPVDEAGTERGVGGFGSTGST